MLSAFHTKFKALKSRLPQSSLDSPWRMALFWMVATVVILAGFLLVISWKVLKAMISGYESRNDEPRNDEKTQAEIADAAFDEGSLLHQHYELNGTIVQGLKDPEW